MVPIGKYLVLACNGEDKPIRLLDTQKNKVTELPLLVALGLEDEADQHQPLRFVCTAMVPDNQGSVWIGGFVSRAKAVEQSWAEPRLPSRNVAARDLPRLHHLLIQVDPSRGVIRKQITLKHTPTALAWHQDRLFVALGPHLASVDLDTNQVLEIDVDLSDVTPDQVAGGDPPVDDPALNEFIHLQPLTERRLLAIGTVQTIVFDADLKPTAWLGHLYATSAVAVVGEGYYLGGSAAPGLMASSSSLVLHWAPGRDAQRTSIGIGRGPHVRTCTSTAIRTRPETGMIFAASVLPVLGDEPTAHELIIADLAAGEPQVIYVRDAIRCVRVLEDGRLITGDDGGFLKLWMAEAP
jgi:hypothetical protein